MPKRKGLSITEKANLLKKYDDLPKCSQREAAAQLGIPQTSLGRMLKNREEIAVGRTINANLGRKRKRDGKNAAVEEALLKWFETARSLNAPIDRSILCDKAKQLAQKLGVEDFNPTDGWLTRWKQRNNIVYRKLHGEKLDADAPAAEHWVKNILPGLLEEYPPEKVFNCDETGLYYRALPDYTMIFKNSLASAGKKQKDRVTILLTCNMTGTIKRKPLVIGKSKNPRCFRGIKNLPVDYHNNKNAWMTSQIFSDFICQWDKTLRIKKEKIVLFLDNCAAHPKLEPKNIKIIFMPANTTSIIQPLDQGIIKTFKTLYRKDMRQTIIAAIDEGVNSAGEIAKKISILDAIHMLTNAWDNVTPIAISNCFRKAGFCMQTDISLDANLQSDVMEDRSLDKWVEIDKDIQVMQEMTDEDIVNEIIGDEVEEEEEEDIEEILPVPTSKEITQSLNVIRRALEQKGGDKEHYSSFYKLQNDLQDLMKDNVKQTTLESYFN